MDTPAPAPASRLSTREASILGLLARGLTDKETADRLGISLGTVRTYRSRMADKLGQRSVGPMMLVAWRRGELDLEIVADEIVASASAAGSSSGEEDA